MAQNRFYLVFIFITSLALVFYLGFLYGNREMVAAGPVDIFSYPANGSANHPISEIDEKPVFGAVFENEAVQKKTFGKFYFVLNQNNHLAYKIVLENVPLRLEYPPENKSVEIPQELKIQYATNFSDEDNNPGFEYQDAAFSIETEAILSFAEIQNNQKSATYSGITPRPITSTANGVSPIERFVLFAVDSDIENIFVDNDPDLPVLVRGNSESSPPIPAAPAPFFWVDF